MVWWHPVSRLSPRCLFFSESCTFCVPTDILGAAVDRLQRYVGRRDVPAQEHGFHRNDAGAAEWIKIVRVFNCFPGFGIGHVPAEIEHHLGEFWRADRP